MLDITDGGPCSVEEEIRWDRMREIIKNTEIAGTFKQRFLKTHLGLKSAVLSGVDWFFENLRSGIVLEENLPQPVSFSIFADKACVAIRARNRYFKFLDTLVYRSSQGLANVSSALEAIIGHGQPGETGGWNFEKNPIAKWKSL